MIMKDPNSSEEQNKVFSYLLKLAASAPVKALMSPSYLYRVEGERQDRRREQSSRQVHGILLVRVDLDARQPQPAPQRFLPGLRQGAEDYPSALDSKLPTELWNWMDAQRRAATSCSRSRTTPT
ncbi:MAG: hypothetical protein U1E63_15215 [Burkholderiales bacterium]